LQSSNGEATCVVPHEAHTVFASARPAQATSAITVASQTAHRIRPRSPFPLGKYVPMFSSPLDHAERLCSARNTCAMPQNDTLDA
jgi:hypothetical protein